MDGLRMSDVHVNDDIEVIYYSTRIFGMDGESKSNRGGIMLASTIPTRVPFYLMA